MRANKVLHRQNVKSSWPFMVQARPPGDTGGPEAQWSQQVTRRSHALELEPGVFTWDDPRAIAQSLKESAELSSHRKAPPFQSAMSMLTFYLNRVGGQLPAEQQARLEAAKDELRALYGRARHDVPGP